MFNISLCGVELKNPLIMASGTFGFGKEFLPYMDISKLGGICGKGLTLHPKEGNYGTRMWETPSGMLNSVGLQNPGVAAFIEKELPLMSRLGTVPIPNLGGNTQEEYIEGAVLLEQAGVKLIELNISCPNVKEGGMAFGMNPAVAAGLIREIKNVVRTPLMVKLSPNAPNIVEMALACEQAGADSLSLINTIQGMVIDVYQRKPMFQNVFAGLSGPAVMPIALRMVYAVCKAVHIPVVGLGGIATAEDVLQFIMAGATAVQIGTANFSKPGAALQILDDLTEWCHRQGIGHISQLQGIAL